MALVLCLVAGTDASADTGTLRPTVFRHVTVVPMDGERVLEDQTVVVRGRRIGLVRGAGDGEVEAPAGALEIDGRGKYLMPGLAEMHGHLPTPDQLERFGEDYLDRILLLNVANGVLTVRGMLGHALQLEARAEIARGDRLGPQLFVAGPSLNGQSVRSEAEAGRAVTEQRGAGFDLLKIHPGITRANFDAIAAVARREGIPFAGHIPLDVGLPHALDSGIASVEHLDGYIEELVEPPFPPVPATAFFGIHLAGRADAARIPAIVEHAKRAGAWNTPTQMLFENFLFDGTAEELAEQRPEVRYMPASLVAGWRAFMVRRGPLADAEGARKYFGIRQQLIRALHEAGVGLILGADAPQVFNVPGFATVRELEAMVRAGLTPYQALVTGTRNPARSLGLEESFGAVAEGMRADLLLVDANPIQDIAAVRQLAGVMVAGRWIPRSELDGVLETLAETARGL